LFGLDNLARAEELAREAVALVHGNQEPWLACYAELIIGLVSLRRGDRREAQTSYEAALSHGRRSGDLLAIGEALRALGRDTDAAVAQRVTWLTEAVAVAHEVGDPRLIQHTLKGLGDLYRLAGRPEDAARAYSESLSVAGSRGLERSHDVLILRGQVALQATQLSEAEDWYRLGLRAALKDRCCDHQRAALLGLAQVAALEEDYQQAATRFAAATRVRVNTTHPVPEDDACCEMHRTTTRAALGDAAWAAAWAAMEAFTEEQAVAVVLGDAHS
jgi:tetratricopeptide (TPR) repeat protein